MCGLPIRFRFTELSLEGSMLFAILAAAILTSPLLFLAFWLAYDGEGYMKRKELERISVRDPIPDAEESIANGDLRLYVTGPYGDRKAPGFGVTNEAYALGNGYRHLPLIRDYPLTEEKENINLAALKYMESYNRIVNAEAERRSRQLQAMKGE